MTSRSRITLEAPRGCTGARGLCHREDSGRPVVRVVVDLAPGQDLYVLSVPGKPVNLREVPIEEPGNS